VLTFASFRMPNQAEKSKGTDDGPRESCRSLITMS
jgi:hypothetical protein